MAGITGKMRASAAALVVGLLLAGCGAAGATGAQSARLVGDVWLFVPATPGSVVEAEVTGSDMESPIVAPLATDGALASGTIDEIEEGSDRYVLITATAPSGRSCSGFVTVDVRAGEVTKVDGPSLECIDPTHQSPSAEERAALLNELATIQ